MSGFLLDLFRMLENADKDTFDASEGCNYFTVINPTRFLLKKPPSFHYWITLCVYLFQWHRFATDILPKYFGSSKGYFNQFLRELIYRGIRPGTCSDIKIFSTGLFVCRFYRTKSLFCRRLWACDFTCGFGGWIRRVITVDEKAGEAGLEDEKMTEDCCVLEIFQCCQNNKFAHLLVSLLTCVDRTIVKAVDGENKFTILNPTRCGATLREIVLMYVDC